MKRALMSAAIAALCLVAACDDPAPPSNGVQYECGTTGCRDDQMDDR